MAVFVRHAQKSLKGVPVLKDVSLDIPSGAVTGLCGGNGSGKTMLLRAVCGLIRLDSGSIEVDGRFLGRDEDFPPSVGMLIETPGFLEQYSGFENLWLLAQLSGRIDRDRVCGALSLVGLDAVARRPYRTYSLGMKQRLGIAAAVMEEPDLVVLDEPTNALDEEGAALVQDIVDLQRARGAAVLVASHDVRVLSCLCGRLYEMHEGTLRKVVSDAAA